MHSEHHVEATAAEHPQGAGLALAAGAEAHQVAAVSLHCQLEEFCIKISHIPGPICGDGLAVADAFQLGGLAGPFRRKCGRARCRIHRPNGWAIRPLRAVTADPLHGVGKKRPNRTHAVSGHVLRPEIRSDLPVRAGLTSLAAHHAGLVVVGVLRARLAEGVGHEKTRVTSARIQVLAPSLCSVRSLRAQQTPVRRSFQAVGPHGALLAQAVHPVLIPRLALAEESLVEGRGDELQAVHSPCRGPGGDLGALGVGVGAVGEIVGLANQAHGHRLRHPLMIHHRRRLHVLLTGLLVRRHRRLQLRPLDVEILHVVDHQPSHLEIRVVGHVELTERREERAAELLPAVGLDGWADLVAAPLLALVPEGKNPEEVIVREVNDLDRIHLPRPSLDQLIPGSPDHMVKHLPGHAKH
mmetsp:Transcript_63808/g.146870  ORF Transcript_63808/g.146870 Transcript_63808/m.146870 type:complete len:411 (+) Transcript_63808:2111-3343(+)